MKQSTKLALHIGITAAIIVAAIGVLLNKQTIIDWWIIQQFVPSSEVKILITNTSMTDRARDLVLASQTQIDTRETFNQNCSDILGEESLVLGCYRAQRIYLYGVTDTRLNGVQEVTAAHEMLHAAYERMGQAERERINSLLDPQIKAITDERLLELIKLYNKEEPGELYNEMHSILATEARDLSPQLETYYKQYFSDRYKVVSYSEGYEGLFTQSKARIVELEALMTPLKGRIDTNNADLQREEQEVKAASEELDRIRAMNGLAAYNEQVPVFNAQVRAFNTKVQETKGLVAEYNRLVEERNSEAAAQNQLRQGLDSKYSTQ